MQLQSPEPSLLGRLFLRPPLPTLVGLLWVGAIAFGLWQLERFHQQPGAPARAPIDWPIESRLVRDSQKPTLVVVAHPQCPCTTATVAELARLMPKIVGQVVVKFLLVQPEEAADAFAETALWEKAKVIPGVEVVRDVGLKEAALFGAETSGQTLLYDKQGKLLFRGGLTSSRGHEGASDGQSAIVQWLTANAASSDAPVYGCPLKEIPPS